MDGTDGEGGVFGRDGGRGHLLDDEAGIVMRKIIRISS